VELTLFITKQVVVTCPRPVAVAVCQDNIQRQELQGGIDIQDRIERCFQLIARCFVQCLAKLDKCGPCLRAVVRFHFETRFVFFKIITKITEPTITVGATTDLPASSLGTIEILSDKFFVELLHAIENTPTFSVNDNLHKIGFGRRNILASDMRVDNGTHHGRVAVTVQEIQCLVTINALVFIDHV
jgi:hypothetical protein